jgi:soluble lytic murein transglycosylase-like protein
MKKKIIYLITFLIFFPTNLSSGLFTLSKFDEIQSKLIINKAPVELAGPIIFASQTFEISHDLIIAIISTESSFIKYAKSCKGYHGYMQIPHRIYEPYQNIEIGTKILKQKIIRANGNLRHAISFYKGYKLSSQKGNRVVKKTLGIYQKMERKKIY